jgi:hypothetical protein
MHLDNNVAYGYFENELISMEHLKIKYLVLNLPFQHCFITI